MSLHLLLIRYNETKSSYNIYKNFPFRELLMQLNITLAITFDYIKLIRLLPCPLASHLHSLSLSHISAPVPLYVPISYFRTSPRIFPHFWLQFQSPAWISSCYLTFNCFLAQIWDSYNVKAQTFKTAIEAACMLLRIDDIVSGIKKKQAPGAGSAPSKPQIEQEGDADNEQMIPE